VSGLVDALEASTRVLPPKATAVPARYGLVLRSAQDPIAVADEVRAAVRPLSGRVRPLSALDSHVLVLELPGRVFVGDQGASFTAAYALSDAFGLEAAEPDLPTGFSPDGDPLPDVADPESAGNLLPWCFAPTAPPLDDRPLWALDAMRVPQAWDYSRVNQRPSHGSGIVIAQPDTGITNHPELRGVSRVAGRDVLRNRADPTDPLDYMGNKGHGTSTGSVLISPEAPTMIGSAPAARHMAIRAIESVVRIRQVTVARAIDWAVEHGAHVITMSLGGLPSFALGRAVRRAVESDVLVLAAAGNCVESVVWPARYDECIAVAGTNVDDKRWRGSCQGPSVDISAPGENVICAVLADGQSNGRPVGQGQGTSFAVALTAGVAGLWLAHHGRANLVAEARARGETLQAMFRRLLRATARRPAGWDSFQMGGGIVDARALLEAAFDVGRDRESVDLADDSRDRTARSVKSLVTETAGYRATLDEAVDWYRHGPEISAVLLRRRAQSLRRSRAGELEASDIPLGASPTPSDRLADTVGRPELRDALGLDPTPEPEIGLEGGGS
jgi:serine protease